MNPLESMDDIMKAINTINEILKLAKVYNENFYDYEGCWEIYMRDQESIRQLCYDDMLSHGQYDLVIQDSKNALVDNLDKVKNASDEFNKSISEIRKKSMDFCPELEYVEVYFVMGLSNAAGWATVIKNVGTIIIGVEKVVSLGWHTHTKMRNLISHELSHETHRLFRGENIEKNFHNVALNSIWQIYIEGYGQCVQQIISGSSDYHQDDGSWLGYCKKNFEELKKEFYDRVVNENSTQDFFGDWNKYDGFSDLGYYLGSKWIESLSVKYSYNEIALLSISEIEHEFHKFFGS